MRSLKNSTFCSLFIIGVAILGVLYIQTATPHPVFAEYSLATYIYLNVTLLTFAIFGMRNNRVKIVKYLTIGYVFCMFLITMILEYASVTVVSAVVASVITIVYCFISIKSNNEMFGYRIDAIELYLNEYSVLGFTINRLAVLFVPAFFLANIIF